MNPWMIVYSDYGPAVERVCAAVQPHLDYTLVCEMAPRPGFNTVTLAQDPTLAGFRITVDEAEGESQHIRITGRDPAHLIYAAADFAQIYLPWAREAGEHCPRYYLLPLFTQPLKPYDRESAPRIDRRGLWLWGYTVYDYRRFIDNMATLKLNTLILWNDCLPVNIRDVLDYAHANGVRVYLGYAWGWDNNMDIIADLSEPVLSRLSDSIVAEHREKYACLPCDGIYFQTFTEHANDTVNGIVIAEAAVDLINRTAARLYETQPDLEILFGLHATSVTRRLDVIARVDPRISVIWEDVGAFPYAYYPDRVEGFEETRQKNRELQDLRSGGFGAVLKGVICLDWSRFRHLAGSYVMGRAAAPHIRRRADEQREILRYIQAHWIENADCARALISDFRRDALITCLVEDSLFEESIPYPVALYAQMLWDSSRETGEILRETAMMPCVTMA